MCLLEVYQANVKIYFLALTSEEPYICECLSVSMSVCLSLCLYVRIVQIWLQTSISQHLIIWFRWNLAHLSTLGCRLWYWCGNSYQQLSSAVNSCQQLFITSWSPKIDVRGLLAKSLFSKKVLEILWTWIFSIQIIILYLSIVFNWFSADKFM